MKEFLERLIEGVSLSEEEAESAMDLIMRGEATASQIAAFLTALRMKGETVEEITGFARSMRKHVIPVTNDRSCLLDTCGTGGTGISKFNISTTAAFITAAAGVPLAKHGNRAMSGKSGSADVLRALGVNIELTPEQARNCLEQVGICFLFAPLYHQSMKHAAEPRKELGFKTVFNMLGPLTNPAGAKRQVLGTFSLVTLEKMAQAVKALQAEHVLVVHGSDGLDEITLTGSTQVAEVKEGRLHQYEIHPEQFGLRTCSPEDIRGGCPETNAKVLRRILDGEKGPERDIAVLNSAAGLYVAGKAQTLKDGVELAGHLIDTGQAKRTLERLISFTNKYRAKELA